MQRTASEAGTKGLIRNLFAAIAVRGRAFTQWVMKGPRRTEYEQALVRMIIAPMLLLYTLWCGWTGLIDGQRLTACLILAGFYIVSSIGIVYLTGKQPVSARAQRIVSLIVDHATLPLGMIAGDLAMAPLYTFFLWITFGYGFRYGGHYFIASASLSLAGFALVLMLSPEWQKVGVLAGGLLIGLTILPVYGYSLWRRLEAAKKDAEAANLAKSRFLATVSHELRTPLHAITSANSLLHTTPISRDQSQLLDGMEQSARQLLLMIDDLLDLSKIDVDKLRPGMNDFSLTGFLHHLDSMFAAQAREKSLWLRIVLDADMPARISGPEKAMLQIVINLIGNALKYTETGGVTLTVANVHGSEGTSLRFDVSDTGPGIPDSAKDSIFDEFSRARDLTIDHTVGSGLGLAIAHRLAVQCGGTLSLVQSEQSGCRFRLILPVTPLPAEHRAADVTLVAASADHWAALNIVSARRITSDKDANNTALANEDSILLLSARDVAQGLPASAAHTQSPHRMIIEGQQLPECSGVMVALTRHAPEAFDGAVALLGAMRSSGMQDRTEIAATVDVASPLSILVAEDHRANARILLRLLESLGHEVRVVYQGDDALDALEDPSFDLAILDINMPEISGLEVVQMVRMTEGAGRRLPIFVLTADVTPQLRQECEDAGVDLVLTKPVNWARLREALATITPVTEVRTSDMSEDAVTSDAEPSDQQEIARLTALAQLDSHKLDELAQLDNGDGFLIDVIDDYIMDTRDISERLIHALNTSDMVSMRDELHGLRSSSAYVGAQALVQICLSWRDLSPEQTRDQRQTLTREFIDVRDASFAALRHECLVRHARDLPDEGAVLASGANGDIPAKKDWVRATQAAAE